MTLLDYLKEFIEVSLDRYRKTAVCESCETLKNQIEVIGYEKRKLIEQIIEITKPQVAQPIEREEPKILQPRTMPWRARQQILEQEDRANARAMREQQEHAQRVKDIKPEDNDALEKEVLEIARQKDTELENAG